MGAADRADRGLDTGVGKMFGESNRRVPRTPICVVHNIFQICDPFTWRVQIACSSASSALEVAIVAETRQPSIRRA